MSKTNFIPVKWDPEIKLTLSALRNMACRSQFSGVDRQFLVFVATPELAFDAQDLPGFTSCRDYRESPTLHPREIGAVELFRFFGPDRDVLNPLHVHIGQELEISKMLDGLMS